MLIALSGYAGAGKDSFADVLVEDHGFKRYAWADTLRLAAEALNPIVGWDEDAGSGPIRYKDALDTVGYVRAKELYPEFREVLQKLGTEVGRNLIDENVWVDATLARVERECGEGEDIVFTDTRFPNEADAVRQMGGHVVRVQRIGVEAVNDHPSETSLDDYDFDAVIFNSGTLLDLGAAAGETLGILRNSALALASS
jgi:hypothetical protein